MISKNNLGKFIKIYLIVFIFILLFVGISYFTEITNVSATNSSSNENGSLQIWDTTENLTRYTFGTTHNKNSDHWNVDFYANYTNATNQSITDGNCSIRFKENLTGYTNWQEALYNASSYYYEYNRSFNYKGNITFQINCNGSYQNFSLTDYARINNTRPEVTAKDDMSGDLLSQAYSEDNPVNYNFSMNCTEDDYNDLSSLTYHILYINNESPSGYTWFSMNTSTGMLKINATRDNQTGSFSVVMDVMDSEHASDSANLPVTISPINDAPQFTNVYTSMNATENVTYSITVSALDEENNTPFYYNVSFVNCTTAEWSDRNNTNCTLFSINQTTGKINFTPSNNDVGNYTINFSVRDSGQSVQPYNASNYRLVIFTVINVNNAPELDYVCDNERSTIEDYSFSCLINATDLDESYNITFSSNCSWFRFNNSASSITVNLSNHVATAQVNFTPNDSAVGNWTIRITARDTADSIGSEVINFFVNNTPDNPILLNISDKSVFAGALFTLYLNASDNDLLIPDKNVYNESLNFTSNASDLFNITKMNVSGNWSIGLINFTPSSADAGNYTIRINVTDLTGNSDYKIFTLTIWNNSAPVWNDSTPTNQTATEDSAFFLNLSQYVYDPDNDSINLSSNASSEFPSFNLTAGGIINFTANDSDVGFHAILITATDNKSAYSSKVFNFTINNINDNPSIRSISNIDTEQENQTIFYIYAYDNDLIINDSFYNETLSFSKNVTNLTGDYRDLFDITVLNTSFNLTTAIVNFTPLGADVGDYTINISVNDTQNSSAYVVFNISIGGVNHAPRISIGNYAGGVNNSFLEYVYATDIDNNSITFTDNSTLFNISLVNQTYSNGITTAYARINFTPHDTDMGVHTIKINATDNWSAVNQSVFTITIYDPPIINILGCTHATSLYEGNTSSTCTAQASQTINESMDCAWFLDSLSVQNATCNEEDTVIWGYSPDYSDEGEHNLTVFVSNDYFTSKDNKTLTVNHNNAPPEFFATISNITSSGTYTLLDLLDHFSDADYDDERYNQSINFSWSQYDSNLSNLTNPTINISQENYTLRLQSSENVSEYVRITAVDSNDSTLNVSSNYFRVNFEIQTETIVVPAPAPSSGGGSSTKPEELVVSINLIIPGAVTMYSVDQIVVPIKLINDGSVNLEGINLKANTTRGAVTLELNKTYFEKLDVGQSEETQLIIKTHVVEVQDLDSFEVDVLAEVQTPKINDSAKILVNILETSRVLKLRAQKENDFLNEFIASNPECLELKETLKEAEEAFNNKDYHKSLTLAENAVESCKAMVRGSEFNNLNPKIITDKNIYLSLIVLLVVTVLLSIFSLYYNKKRASTR